MRHRHTSRRTVRTVRSFYRPASVSCQTCGTEFSTYHPKTVRCHRCEVIARLVSQGLHVPTLPDGTEPAMYLHPDGTNVTIVCTSCRMPVNVQDADYRCRCRFCALPGESIDHARKLSHDGTVLHVRACSGGEYAVPLTADGLVSVHVLDQTRGDMGPRLVSPADTPAWGTGWSVRTDDGWRDYLSNWDSSG